MIPSSLRPSFFKTASASDPSRSFFREQEISVPRIGARSDGAAERIFPEFLKCSQIRRSRTGPIPLMRESDIQNRSSAEYIRKQSDRREFFQVDPVIVHVLLYLFEHILILRRKKVIEPALGFEPFRHRFLLARFIRDFDLPFFVFEHGPEESIRGKFGNTDRVFLRIPPAPVTRSQDVYKYRTLFHIFESFFRFRDKIRPVSDRGLRGVGGPVGRGNHEKVFSLLGFSGFYLSAGSCGG